MRIRKKTLALLLFSTGFICTVAVSALVLWQTDVLRLPVHEDQPVAAEPDRQGLLYPVCDGQGLWGYMNEQGQLIIQPAYEEAKPFYGKAAWVKQNGLWGAVDAQGQLIVPAEYEDIAVYADGDSRFVAGLNAVSSSVYPAANSALYDVNGSKLFGLAGKLGEMSDGLMPFSRRKGEQESWGYINAHGEIVIEPVYAQVGEVSGNYALVRDFEGKTLLLNIYAKNAVEYTEAEAPELDGIGSRLILVRQGLKYGYASVSGGIVIECQYDWARPFRGGAAYVEIGGKQALIGPEGQLLVELKEYADSRYLGEGLYAFREQGEPAWTVFNSQGKQTVAEPVYEFGSWSGGLLAFCTESYTGFLNKEGQVQSGLELSLLPDVCREGNLYYLQDANGLTWFDEHGLTLWDSGRERELAPGVRLLTVWENTSGAYMVSYPQVETEAAGYWTSLNRALAENALGECYAEYRLGDELQYTVRGGFELSPVGQIMNVKQRLVLDDSWAAGGSSGLEEQINTVCFGLADGRQYNLAELFRRGVNWRSELLEPARGAYSVRCAGNNEGEDPEVLEFLERRLPRNIEFSLSYDKLGLYIPLSNGRNELVEIHFQDIEQLLDEDGELWQRLRADGPAGAEIRQ